MTEAPIAIVTGGSRGIGRAIAKSLLEEGWRTFLCSRSAERLAETVAELDELAPGCVEGRAVDVRSQEEVDAHVDAVVAAAGRIDCLVNNAGLGRFGPVDELTGEEWRTVLRTNLDGPFYYTRAVAPVMRRQGSGWIVNVASLAGKNPFAGGAAYNASKFGLVGFSEASMLDLRHDGIRVTAIMPGSVASDFHTRRRPDRDWMLHPEDVARTVVDLLRYPERALPSRIELRPSQPK